MSLESNIVTLAEAVAADVKALYAGKAEKDDLDSLGVELATLRQELDELKLRLPPEDSDLYLMPNGVTIAAQPNTTKGKWHSLGGKDYYVAIDYDDLVSVVGLYKGLSGDGEVFADLTRDDQTKSIPLNQVVTTFVDKFSTGSYNSGLFSNARTFNQLISSWDTSNVTNMYYLFLSCRVINQDISGWDTRNVTNMGAMFSGCYEFNQDISGWNTSNVTNMGTMFQNCKAFNQDIGGWDTSNVTDMGSMFNGCSVINQDISGWCVSNIPSKPAKFDTNTPTGWTTARKPNWGAPC